MIYILTGNIRSGKTSALKNWVKIRSDVDGLLCPDNEKGKRYFLKIKSQKEIELEVESEDENTISIGPYNFLRSAFDKANDFLISLASKDENQYLIIDELGKLELKKIGLHDSAKSIITQHENSKSHHLILVVRESLLNEIITHYNISEYSVLRKEDLGSLD